jgi:hypothetical protein
MEEIRIHRRLRLPPFEPDESITGGLEVLRDSFRNDWTFVPVSSRLDTDFVQGLSIISYDVTVVRPDGFDFAGNC